MNEFVASTIRHLLTLAAGALVARHLLQPEQAPGFIDEAFRLVANLAPYLLAQAWSYWEKR